MNIDQRLTDLHQWVVDVTERQPAWWAEQVTWAYIATGLVTNALHWRGWISVLFMIFDLVMGTIFLLSTRVSPMFSSFGRNGMYRAMSVAVLAMVVSSLALEPEVWKIPGVFQELCVLSYLYFATCRPPQPRRRRQLATQNGTA